MPPSYLSLATNNILTILNNYTLFESHLSYCVTVWGNIPQYKINDVHKKTFITDKTNAKGELNTWPGILSERK